MSKFEKCQACSADSHESVPMCPTCGVRKSTVIKTGGPIRKVSPAPAVLVAISKSGAEPPAEPTFAEIRKAAAVAVEKAQADFAAAQTRFEKANNIPEGRGINAFIERDPDARDLYRAVAEAGLEAHALERHGVRVRAVKAKIEAREDAMVELEKGLVAFAKAQNIPNVWTDGLKKYRDTDEGRALYDAAHEK